MELTQALKNNYVFRGVAPEIVAGLAILADVRRYQGGDLIVRQFERSQDLIVLLDGVARIRGIHGETLAEFGPGSVIGEMALLDEAPRSANVASVGPTRVAVISGDMLRQIMDEDAETRAAIYGNLSRVLSRRLRSMNALAESTTGVR